MVKYNRTAYIKSTRVLTVEQNAFMCAGGRGGVAFFASDTVLCVLSSHLFWTSSSLDVPAGVTQEEGHTGFLIRLPSAVRAFIFLARRIQPFLSLVDREVEFCVITIESFSICWAVLFFYFLSEKKSRLPGFELTSQRVRRLRGYF